MRQAIFLLGSASTHCMRVLRFWLEARLLAAVAFVSGSLWVFIELAEAVLANGTHDIDTAILLALRVPGHPADALGPVWLQEMIRDLTALGSPVILSLWVITATTILLLTNRWRTALFVAAATGGGTVLSLALKQFFYRPRPALISPALPISTPSFPSGHAMLAAVVYLTLAALVSPLLPTKRLKLFVMAMAILLIAVIGASRIYLAVHWPSDVLGGWAVGAAWALGCWLLARTFSLDRSGES